MTERDATSQLFSTVAARIHAAASEPHVIGFSGPLGGDGTTTVAMGTAIALTTLQTKSVLLIDANWADPALSTSSRATSSPGLLACLAGASLADALRPSSNPRLYLLPAGASDGEPQLGELRRLLKETSASFPYVLVDLPPVLVSTAIVLSWSGLLDRLFLVVRAGRGRGRPLRQAVDALAPITQPALILNGVLRETKRTRKPTRAALAYP